MDIGEIGRQILDRRREVPTEQAMLVGISGIDASGKGFVAEKLAAMLESAGKRVALINIDGWLNLPSVRFSDGDPGRQFYEHALRLEQAFEDLILPLRRDRTVDIVVDLVEETAHEFCSLRYTFDDIDIIVVEGIFLFKRTYKSLFDLRVLIECSLETALSRAVARRQEGLTPAETVRAYETIYFPAQRVHLELDRPSSAADIVFRNDDIQG